MNEAPRLTRNQSMVLAALSHANEPVGAYALLDQLRSEGFRAPLQVYRALDKLQSLGLVHRLESLNAFVACTHPHDHRSELVAFAICENCGKVEEFSDEAVEESLHGLTDRSGFTARHVTIELRGECRTCHAA